MCSSEQGYYGDNNETSTKKPILMEDDCAPDAREFFDKRLKERTGLTIMDFKTYGKVIEDGYSYKGYSLKIYCDDPYYSLFKNMSEVG